MVVPAMAAAVDFTPSRREFDLVVSWEEHVQSGFTKEMFLINGQSPGPVIEVHQDDWVVVHLHNNSPHNTTVHFHGIEMAQTPWSDGVPGVSQYPIKPGHSFKYEFQAAQYGSYWYHSHFRGQIEDGLLGPVLIHPRRDKPKPFDKVSTSPWTIRALEEAERQVYALVISDYMHIPYEERWNLTLEAGVELSCFDSILFNGKGRVKCRSKEELEANLGDQRKGALKLVPGAEITDKGCLPAEVMIALGGSPGHPARLPLGTFSGCNDTEGPIEVIKARKWLNYTEDWISLDLIGGISYVTGLVSIDEHDMWVYAVDGSYITPQKVQALSLTNGDRYSVFVKLKRVGDFRIRFACTNVPQIITGHAVLSVEGENPIAESQPYISIAGIPLRSDLVLFNQSIASPFPPDPIAQHADALYVLHMNRASVTYLWSLNTTRLMPMSLDDEAPVLFHPNRQEHNNTFLTTNRGDWIDLVFFASEFPMAAHPIHKHGTKMYQIGSGTGRFKWNSVEEAIKEIPELFNLKNPPRRDAFASAAADNDFTWVVVRYHAKNPGAWLLHCHINNHLIGGMEMVIQDGIDQWPEIPSEYYPED